MSLLIGTLLLEDFALQIWHHIKFFTNVRTDVGSDTVGGGSTGSDDLVGATVIIELIEVLAPY